MSNRPLISVIIPVYNMAESITTTLDSVINQTYNNLQIIIINDGSTDTSLDICKRYQENDNRIDIIDKENEGLTMARKSGLSVAKGEYIHHFDGGDMLELECYDKIVNQLVKNNFPDIILFDFYYFDGKISQIPNSYPDTLKSPIDYLLHIWTTQQYNCVWQYVHKKEICLDIVFDSNINLGEDTIYTSQLLYNASSIFHYKEYLIYYVTDDNSMSRSKYNKDQISSVLLFPDIIRDLMSKKPETINWEKELLALKLQSYATLIRNGVIEIPPEASVEIEKGIKKYPDLKDTGLIRTIMKIIRLYRINPILSDILISYYRYKKKIR